MARARAPLPPLRLALPRLRLRSCNLFSVPRLWRAERAAQQLDPPYEVQGHKECCDGEVEVKERRPSPPQRPCGPQRDKTERGGHCARQREQDHEQERGGLVRHSVRQLEVV